jgi:hypothetical protein
LTVRLANEIRETGMPVYCSACMNQQPKLRHVDFDAATDRGYGNEEAVKVVMDDLILCEGCVKRGAELLGMVDSEEQAEHVADLERRLNVEERRYKQAQGYADRMEDALQHRAKPITLDHRQKPRQIKEMA